MRAANKISLDAAVATVYQNWTSFSHFTFKKQKKTMLKAFLDEQHAFALFPTGFVRSSGAQRLATGW